MRNIIIGILLSFFLISCETVFQNSFIIQNSTSHRIEITGFYNDQLDSSGSNLLVADPEKIIIEPNSEYRIFKEAGFHYQHQGIFKSYEVDSITIVFDSEKIISYACTALDSGNCSDKYNLMNLEENYIKNLTGKSSGKNEYSFTYTFYEEDYENSKWIK